MKLSAPDARRRHRARVKDFDGYLFLLPNGAGGHGRYPDRLRCGRRNVQITIAADPRPPKVMQRDGPLPQTRADPRRQG
jgi:hypothetical protein